MYEAKTKPTKLSVAEYLAAIENDERRKDCKALTTIMKRVTGCAPVMWGTSIVGFDQYHYKYASGHEGDACIVGFSNRKGDISVYLMPGYDMPEMSALLAKLGPHKIGKACLYLKRLEGIDLKVLERMVEVSVKETKRKYPTSK